MKLLQEDSVAVSPSNGPLIEHTVEVENARYSFALPTSLSDDEIKEFARKHFSKHKKEPIGQFYQSNSSAYTVALATKPPSPPNTSFVQSNAPPSPFNASFPQSITTPLAREPTIHLYGSAGSYSIILTIPQADRTDHYQLYMTSILEESVLSKIMNDLITGKLIAP